MNTTKNDHDDRQQTRTELWERCPATAARYREQVHKNNCPT